MRFPPRPAQPRAKNPCRLENRDEPIVCTVHVPDGHDAFDADDVAGWLSGLYTKGRREPSDDKYNRDGDNDCANDRTRLVDAVHSRRLDIRTTVGRDHNEEPQPSKIRWWFRVRRVYHQDAASGGS